MLQTWRGPALLRHPSIEPNARLIGAFTFIAGNEAEAIRHARDVYNASAWGTAPIEVGIAGDEDDMRRSMRDVSVGRSKTIKIYCDASAALPPIIPSETSLRPPSGGGD
jgi:hypothetical protein